MDDEYHSTLYGVSKENLSQSANKLASGDMHFALYNNHHKIAKDAIKQGNSRLAEFHAGRAEHHDLASIKSYSQRYISTGFYAGDFTPKGDFQNEALN